MNDDTDMRFGELLKCIIKNSSIKNREFYERLNIKKAYFYDIINGRTNPPPPDKQFAIVKILDLDDQTRNQLFDAAAKERNEFPADLSAFIDEKAKESLRSSQEYKLYIGSLRDY